MIRGSDGLDYEDLNARLLGEPADTGRNRILGPNSRYDEAFKADYREAYDHYEAGGYFPWECHNCATAQADFSREQRASRALHDALRASGNDFGVITITTPSTYF